MDYKTGGIKMKKIIKGSLAVLAFFILVGACSAIFSTEEQTSTEPVKEPETVQEEPVEAEEEVVEEPVEETPVEEEVVEEPVVEENSPLMSKAEFDQIKSGMSYEEVVEIVGSEGEVQSEVGAEGEQFHTIMYMWEGEGMIGANANVMFQEGKLETKAQFGLE